MKKKIFRRLKDKIERKISKKGRIFTAAISQFEEPLRRLSTKSEPIINNWRNLGYRIEQLPPIFLGGKPIYNLTLPTPSWVDYANSTVSLNIQRFVAFPLLDYLGDYDYGDIRTGFHSEKGRSMFGYLFLESISDSNRLARGFIENYLRNKSKIDEAFEIFDYEYPISFKEGEELAERLGLRYK